MDLFTINCPTCRARLKVRERSAIGQIVNCPKCRSMMQISPPADWQPPAARAEPAQTVSADQVSAAAIASALAAADSGVRWSDTPPPAPAEGAAGFPAIQTGHYIDPLAVKVDVVAAAAPPLPAVPSAHLPVIREFLVAWLPWTTVPLAGILSALLVSYCLRVDEPPTVDTLRSSETIADVSPDAPTAAENPREPAAARPAVEAPSPTFAETHLPPAPLTGGTASPPAAGVATPPPAPSPATPQQPRIALRPVVLPLDLEAAARSAARTEIAGRPARPARPALPPMPPPAVVVKPKPALPSSSNVPEVDVEQALATRIAGLDLPSMPLLAFVQLAGGLVGAPLTLDLDACRELGIQIEAPLAVHEQDVSLADLLSHVLAPLGLVAEATRGQLIVTSTPAHRYQLQQVRYNVSDFNDTPAVLARMIQELVEPRRWMAPGGAGRIDIDGPQLLISQTPRVQHQVVVLLDKLRLARGKPATGGLDALEGSLETPYRQLSQRLATLVSANYREPTELQTIVYELGSPAGLRVLVNWQSLADAGCRPKSLVSLVVDKQPLAAALDQLLGPLNLSYRIVSPDMIEIASTSALRERPELDAYPAGPLLDTAAAGEAPTDAVAGWFQRQLPGIAWGGGSGWRLDRQSSVLLVRHDAMSQRTIDAAIQAASDDVGREGGAREEAGQAHQAAIPASRQP